MEVRVECVHVRCEVCGRRGGDSSSVVVCEGEEGRDGVCVR